jgi:hypothetical protein
MFGKNLWGMPHPSARCLKGIIRREAEIAGFRLNHAAGATGGTPLRSPTRFA